MKKRIGIAAGLAAGSLVLLLLGGYLAERTIYGKAAAAAPSGGMASAADLAKSVRGLEARIKALEPRGLIIVIDTAANRLTLRKAGRTIKEFVVSCGSGGLLEDPGGGRKWIFDTPRGEFAVQSRLVNPTWIKPDWAFIEEGEKPPTDYNERIDNDTLGDYALGFGDGYFIHGTLYTRLLGRNVTHGCVRVGDKDLAEVYGAASLGTRVYIY